MFETTVPVGTTRERLIPILRASGLEARRGFPRRLLAGTSQEQTCHAPLGRDSESHWWL